MNIIINKIQKQSNLSQVLLIHSLKEETLVAVPLILAERGANGGLRPTTPFTPGSLSMRPLATWCGASYDTGSRPPR